MKRSALDLMAWTPGAARAIATRRREPVIYLAGPINGRTDEECRDWRTVVAGTLRDSVGEIGAVAILDPMRRDYRGRENDPGIDAEIVKGDLEDVAACDVFFAFCPKPSAGTSMEILLAAQMQKLVVVVHPPARPSPWVTYHASALFHELEPALAFVIANLSR